MTPASLSRGNAKRFGSGLTAHSTARPLSSAPCRIPFAPMRRARRSSHELRLELTPLLDVMFLLLTFFIFAFVLMVRLEVTDIRLPGVQAGAPVQRLPSITITVAQDGSLTIAGRAVQLGEVTSAIETARAQEPGAQLLIAVDERSPAGEIFKLMDTLRAAGHSDLRFLRAPQTSPAP